MIIITLDLPSKQLYPNRKNGLHWAVTKKAKDADYAKAYYAAPVKHCFTNDNKLEMHLTYCFTDRRRRDVDNILAAQKSSLDAVFAKLKLDDSQVVRIVIEKILAAKEGKLILQLTEIEGK